MTTSHAYPWGNGSVASSLERSSHPKPSPKPVYDDAVKFKYVYPHLRGAAK